MNESLRFMGGLDFEDMVERLINKMGFDIQERKKTPDGGFEYLAFTEQPLYKAKNIIHCKNTYEPVGISKVRDLYKVLKIPVIGCGGIDSWQDVVEFFLAGASAVQIGTALYNGTEIITEINQGITQYLKDNNYNSINDLKGLTHQFKTQEVPDFD